MINLKIKLALVTYLSLFAIPKVYAVENAIIVFDVSIFSDGKIMLLELAFLFLLLIIVILVVIFVVLKIKEKIKERIKQKQHVFISSYEFDPLLKKRVKGQYPDLNNKQIDSIFEGLRAYFNFCHMNNKEMLAMPSKAIDTAWHEFILCTRMYEAFSKKAMGEFLHHTPTEKVSSEKVSEKSIKKIWYLSCLEEGINPRKPDKLPLLFAMDELLNIEGGFNYSLKIKYSDGRYCVSDYHKKRKMDCMNCGSCSGGSSGD